MVSRIIEMTFASFFQQKTLSDSIIMDGQTETPIYGPPDAHKVFRVRHSKEKITEPNRNTDRDRTGTENETEIETRTATVGQRKGQGKRQAERQKKRK